MHHAKAIESNDVARRISDGELASHLERFLQKNDPGLLTAALGKIARAKGMSQLSRDTGISRATLYRALSIKGDPSLSMVIKVAEALGIKVQIMVVTVAGGRTMREEKPKLEPRAPTPQKPLSDQLKAPEPEWIDVEDARGLLNGMTRKVRIGPAAPTLKRS
jgi:probable addiction module antidote protein